MNHKALVVIDIQNDITKHYRDIIDRLNAAIEWAAESGVEIVYIQHNNLSAGTRTFKPGTKGTELVSELKIVSDHIFVKTKANALTSEAFSKFIRSKELREFYITGADATACVKSTCFNMARAGYTVHVVSDCVTSYDLKKMPEMLSYYAEKGWKRMTEIKPGNGKPDVILLNGPSSAGKSSIAKALRQLLLDSGANAVILSLDDYLQMSTNEPIWEDDVFAIIPRMCADIRAALQDGLTAPESTAP